MTTDIKTPGIVLALFLSSLASTSQAAPFVLKSCDSSNAPTPCDISGANAVNGAVEVGVDGYGNFGLETPNRADTGAAELKQNTPVAPENTARTSYVALRIATGAADPFAGQLSGATQLIGSGTVTAAGPGGAAQNFVGPNGGSNASFEPGSTATKATSTFSGADFGAFQVGLDFELTQTIQIYDPGTSSGDLATVLYQQYVITNTTAATIKGELLRYADFNLDFGKGNDLNGAGFTSVILNSDGTVKQPQYLAVTRIEANSGSQQTYAAISAAITDLAQKTRQETTTDRYAAATEGLVASLALTTTDGVSTAAGLSNLVQNGKPFPASTTSDNLSDSNSIDFAVAFRNAFVINAGESILYTTQTLWGKQVSVGFNPPSPPNLGPGPGVPVPGTLPLLGIALWGLTGMRRRRPKH